MSAVLAFLAAHPELIGAALVALLRAVPASSYERFELAHPRLALLYRAARKALPDVIPALRAIVDALRTPAPPPPPTRWEALKDRRGRVTVLPPPPHPRSTESK